jgi:hypothetical protein
MAVARRGTSWDLVIRNAVLDRTPVDDDLDDVAVTYALTHNGVATDSGSLTWEAHDYENAWAKRLTLPSTAGVLTAVVTISGTVDGDTLIGTRQASVEVV